MVTNEEVGRRIREAREELHLSQGDLGRLLTRPRTHAAVSDIERGKTKLDVEELSELAVLLKKDLSYFYGIKAATAASPSMVYRRSERGLSPEDQRVADRAVESFKQVARRQAQQKKREG